MGPSGLLVPISGFAGIIIGAIAMTLISRRPAAQKAYPPKLTEKAETLSVLGEEIDVRELRILRALFGEPKGRRLGAFKDHYYRPCLAATIDKGWVKRIGSRYFLTAKGGEFCQTYFMQVLSDLKAAD